MRLNIGGLTPFTTIDFPGHLAAVVFLQGCSWRCSYCHNPHLLEVDKQGDNWEMLQNFLEQRRGFLDGVVLSGGEPLLQSGLAAAIANIKAMGFKVALHTAGSNPHRLEQHLTTLDWVGLDIKTSFKNYPKLTGVTASGDKVRQSLALLVASDVDYEVRTTIDPNFFTRAAVLELAEMLMTAGVTHYAVQECRPVENYKVESPSLLLDPSLLAQLEGMFDHFTLRYS
ncbi:MAG: anaerobic ribonucleoside-triphosphate reductase activating protein [Methylophaga sp.]|nr:MAG: anaerobic ribonucleoside-triphosphate reductase activating protein [Methylophaga sp.]